VATVIGNEAQVKMADLVGDLGAQAAAQVDQAKAQVDQAAAQLTTAELNLTYTEIRAPQDGWITHRNVQVGSYVQPGQALVSLVAPDIWIAANFKENQLNRMRLGQEVTIKIDAFKDIQLKGHVDSLQMGTGAVFTTFPAENATGNFVKIVQRIPVKIKIDSGTDPERPLPLGLSVEPEVHLK
jgi:membrane fusion protein (multidrug efflux system)